MALILLSKLLEKLEYREKCIHFLKSSPSVISNFHPQLIWGYCRQ